MTAISQPTDPHEELPHVRVPIRIKITLPFVTLALLLALAAAYIGTQMVMDTVENRFHSQLAETGRLGSQWMVKQQDSQLETLRLLSNTTNLAQALSSKNPEELRNLSLGLVVEKGVDDILFLDSTGALVLALRHREGSTVEDYESITGGDTDFTSFGFIEDILSGREDELGDKYSGLGRMTWGDYFYVSGPVRDAAGSLQGIILVGERVASIVGQVKLETLANYTIYDLNGQPIASTLPDVPPLDSDSVSDVLTGQDSQSLIRKVSIQRGMEIEDIDYQEILGPFESRGGEDIGLLGVALTPNFMVTTSQSTQIRIALLATIALALVVIVGITVANYITRPITTLVRASSEVSHGNLDIQVPTVTNDEVAVLAETFNHMIGNINRSRKDLMDAYDSTLEGWSKFMEMRDKETEGHTQRVTDMTLTLARKLGIPEDEIVHIRRGALLHDIGKMGISDHILLKPGPLSDEEWVEMHKHPEYALQILWPIEYLRPAVDIPYCHHERWNGSGYPRGIAGEDIPLAARIFSIVDVWDALITDRPYRKAMPREEVIAEIKLSSGTFFDPQIVKMFFETFVET